MALAAKKYPILIVCAKILPPPPNTRLLGNRGGSLGLGPWYHDGLETHCIYRGRKNWQSDMTYSQGMAAQITAATAIGIASATGMPVSTTHVLSSAVAGTMVANRGWLAMEHGQNYFAGLGIYLTCDDCAVGGVVLSG